VAEQYDPTPMPADAGFTTAMANLATATSADREKAATLTRAIATLTDQLKAKDTWRNLKRLRLEGYWEGKAMQGQPPLQQARQQPKSENPTEPTMITTAGHMVIKLD
jgi:hypothetical protein